MKPAAKLLLLCLFLLGGAAHAVAGRVTAAPHQPNVNESVSQPITSGTNRRLLQLGGLVPAVGGAVGGTVGTVTGTVTNVLTPGNPATRDWAAVVSACKALGAAEKATMNYFVRAAAREVPSTSASLTGVIGTVLSVDDLLRPASPNADFDTIASLAAQAIATFYQVSVADVKAVCGAVATEVLGGPSVVKGLKVGRKDSTTPTAGSLLTPPGATTNLASMAAFWASKGYSVEEAVALLGAHTLSDEQQCFRGRGNSRSDYCNPTLENCADVRMFNWTNQFFVDGCTPALEVNTLAAVPPSQRFERDQAIPTLGVLALFARQKHELCKFTGQDMRTQAMKLIDLIRQGQVQPPAAPAQTLIVRWSESPRQCANKPNLPPIIKANCQHSGRWWYPETDALLGQACQTAQPADESAAAVKAAMIKFLNPAAWNAAYGPAYNKMVNTDVAFVDNAITITGTECTSGYTIPQCTAACDGGKSPTCPASCVCLTAFVNGKAAKTAAALATVTGVAKALLNPQQPFALAEPSDNTDSAAAGRRLLQASIPGSPYGAASEICSSGGAYSVDGFPGSPFTATPFVDVFKNPPTLPPIAKGCRADGHCLFEFEMDIKEFQAGLFDNAVPACKGNPTWLMGYGGSSPGPTIVVPRGHEGLVRFNNKVTGEYYELGYEPCVDGRQGRPFSIHFHGSNSLPPYDGWAEDETCGGESKDYILPNQRATTGWYHDHALHITADNAYAGLAGFYLMSASSTVGGCGDAWNMDTMEERHLIFQDKVMDNKCQLLFQHNGAHLENLYGDINLVSGIPWPRMPLEPKAYRFRMLNAATSRPYLVLVRNQAGANVHQDVCYIVATDGGYLEAPKKVPARGVLMGVAERYDMVCDFSKFANQQLYMWNGRNEDVMKDVPMFCYSHLLSRLEIGGAANDPKPVFNITATANRPGRPMTRIFSPQDYQKAVAMANDERSHRQMEFGRSNGQWVINGETWDSFTIAARDVGQNTWEVWELKTGGGWFHPIHIHLVDFFVLKRDRDGGIQPYEQLAPKDVVYLGPSQEIWVVARFGAHRGDYMFHCHNLVHEDNDMMRAMRVVQGSQGRNKGTQFINNQAADVIYNNWAYNNPLYGDTNAKPSGQWPALGAAHATEAVNKNLYRIFYPTADDSLANAANNPWAVNWCPVPQA